MPKSKSQQENRDSLLSFLWYEIIRIGFSPSVNDQRRWIYLFQRSLYEFWGLKDSIPNTDAPSFPLFKVRLPSIGENQEILFECQIDEQNKKFTVKVQIGNILRWVHHYDGTYFIPPSNLSVFSGNRKLFVKNVTREDVKYIIQRLIFHPCVHQHVNDAPKSIEHKIRIGGGITNSFLYLFHLRYQLCLPPPDPTTQDVTTDQKKVELNRSTIDKREVELNRLTELFYSAIQEKKDCVSAKDLLAVPSF